ncbi:unnamed protein product [Spirodela intermedia]|uniref:Uncharacterized protein n=2 Tax=Spirodela intermedia TaxID=51605 RepID=A0A7I8IRZ8_SPIIN|nr:unnamed protein product [Spirodela intermedia]CAA6660732.1 unnamed protein product [Spirodela intermedia]CAA7397099.1 unnamed protein product [Spirodela intermedia]
MVPSPSSHPASRRPWTWSARRREEGRGASTAQANLRRIVAVISTVPPPQPFPNAFPSEFFAPTPPPTPATGGRRESRELSGRSDGQGVLVDLRLRLGTAWEEDHEAGLLSSACSAVGEETTNAVVVVVAVGGNSPAPPKTAESEELVSGSFHRVRDSGLLVVNSFSGRSSEGECDADGAAHDVGAEEEEEEEVKEVRGRKDEEDEDGRPSYSEITNVRENASGGEEESDGSEDATVGGKMKNGGGGVGAGGRGKEKRCRRGDEGYLGLLLEAVRQVSGELFGIDEVEEEEAEDEPGGKPGSAGKSEKEEGTCFPGAVAAAAALGPVVRSKRGRSQVLPSRYRDSVLEPWRKQPGGGGGGHHHLQRRRQGRTVR